MWVAIDLFQCFLSKYIENCYDFKIFEIKLHVVSSEAEIPE